GDDREHDAQRVRHEPQLGARLDHDEALGDRRVEHGRHRRLPAEPAGVPRGLGGNDGRQDERREGAPTMQRTEHRGSLTRVIDRGQPPIYHSKYSRTRCTDTFGLWNTSTNRNAFAPSSSRLPSVVLNLPTSERHGPSVPATGRPDGSRRLPCTSSHTGAVPP